MKAFHILFSLTLCLILISTFSVPLFALSRRPDVPHDETSQFIPNPFAEGDALRYGGLFGPLPNPWEDDIPLSWNIDYRNINTREMGFAVDEPHYIATIRERQSS